MCNKVDNSCRDEKRGCQGCYYNSELRFNNIIQKSSRQMEQNILNKLNK